MVRKFMKNKKIIIPILILIVSVIVIGLFYKVNKVRNTEVTIKYAEGVIPSGSVQNEDTEQRWETLNEKTDNKEFRELVNKLFWITEEEQTTGTLASLISDKSSHYDELRAYLSSIYTDIDENSPDSLIQAAAINNYFNIYDDSKGEFNGGAYLSRTQYMAGVARAIMPVSSDIEKADKVFIEKVGEENRSHIEDREVELASTLSNQSYLRGKNVTAKVYGYKIYDKPQINIHKLYEVYDYNTGKFVKEPVLAGVNIIGAPPNIRIEDEDLDEGLYKVVAYCGGKPKDGESIPSNLSHWNKNKDTAWEYLTANLNKTTEGGGATDEGGGKDDEPDPYKATNIEGEFGKFEIFSD